MKCLSDFITIHNSWHRFGIEYVVWDIFPCHVFSCVQQLKITKLPTRENFGPTKHPLEKNLGPTKYPREKIWDPRNIHEKKFWTHEIPTKARWHNGIRPTRRTMAPDPRTLARSWLLYINIANNSLVIISHGVGIENMLRSQRFHRFLLNRSVNQFIFILFDNWISNVF